MSRFGPPLKSIFWAIGSPEPYWSSKVTFDLPGKGSAGCPLRLILGRASGVEAPDRYDCHDMQARTIATLQQIESISWFSQVGQNLEEDVVACSSWELALKYAAQLRWENYKYQKAGDLSEALMRQDRNRYRKWNSTVRELKAALEAKVFPAVRAYQHAQGLPDLLLHEVQWDMLHVLLEAEYSDVIEPGFYTDHAFWYFQGHFPCGWESKEGNFLPRVY